MNIEKIEIKPGQWVWVDDTQIKDVRPYIGRWHLESGQILNKLPTYLTDLSECKLVIAASPSLQLEGVPDYVEYLAEQEMLKEQYKELEDAKLCEPLKSWDEQYTDGHGTTESSTRLPR